MNHFEHLLGLLRLEKEEDERQFIESVHRRPLPERVKEGVSWYPLNVLQTGFSIGEKAFVTVERTTQLDQPHQLRSGMSVQLFTLAPHVKHPEKTGVIHFVERNKMKIILNARDVPDWLSLGQLGVDMLFDDRTYAEMERALRRVMEAKKDRIAEIRNLLSPKPSQIALEYSLHALSPQNYPAPDQAPTISGLNPSQAAAVNAILNSTDVSIIHGPPGTGKTTTLVAAIELLCQRENTVLVTAPSNTAADLLTERLASKGLFVVRVGNVSRVDESVVSHTLEAILARHPESKNVKKVKIQAAEYRRQSRKFKRTFDAEDRREREHLKSQARELEAWANTLEQRLIDEILTSAQAITCTLVGAAHPVLEKFRFRTCIIDEAAQALEPACWIPILKSSRVVLAGDPFQLPPTVKNYDAARQGLQITLIERAIAILPDRVQLLHIQYRMHRAIMNFSNRYFYGGVLKAHETVGERRLFDETHDETLMNRFAPVTFVDTAGCGFDERMQNQSSDFRAASRFNPEEALLVREHLLQLLQHYPESVLPSVGILSPYREQVNTIEQLLREDAELSHLPAQARAKHLGGGLVNTIDGFQGQERDIIYISLVRSNTKNEIGFLSDYRRMNVAMTRARMALVVIGDSATIGNNKFYSAFLDYCAAEGQYQTAWEYMR